MLKYIVGDITEVASKDAIVMQQVNCRSTMGSGVALAILKKHPRVRSEYMAVSKQYTPDQLLGQAQLVFLHNNLTFINSFTQLNFGNSRVTGINYTSEDLLIKNLLALDNYAKEKNLPAYIPKFIGCGLAGGNWDTVESAIKDTDLIVVSLKK